MEGAETQIGIQGASLQTRRLLKAGEEEPLSGFLLSAFTVLRRVFLLFLFLPVPLQSKASLVDVSPHAPDPPLYVYVRSIISLSFLSAKHSYHSSGHLKCSNRTRENVNESWAVVPFHAPIHHAQGQQHATAKRLYLNANRCIICIGHPFWGFFWFNNGHLLVYLCFLACSRANVSSLHRLCCYCALC